MQKRQPAQTRQSSPFKAQAPVSTTRWPRWNGSWLRLDPERDQARRAAEAIKREKEAGELKQTTDEFVEAGARLAEALRQVTAVSFTASEAAAIVVKAVSELVEATNVINGDLESYVRLVVS